MGPGEAALLVGGGFAAGVVNSLAGGGSLLTVSLLVVLGIPGVLANGTNRVGLLVQNAVAAWRFRAEGVSGFRSAGPLLAPVVLGSLVGAYGISQVADETFERGFGVLMIALLVPLLRHASPARGSRAPRRWPLPLELTAFFGIGIYAGAFQVGVGIPLLYALSYAGFDLVRANSIKVVVILAVTLAAVPVFALGDHIAWRHAGVLAIGFFGGGEAGARLAVRGGERLVRPVLVVAVLALAGRMLGLY